MPKKKVDKAEVKRKTLAMIKIDALENKKDKTQQELAVLRLLKEKHGI